MQFAFATATRILFGEGMVREAAPAARAMGRRALVVTGASRGRASALIAELDAVPFGVAGEPSLASIRLGAAAARPREHPLGRGRGSRGALRGCSGDGRR
ncbi:Iron-containing alcohol dehydrogenase (fragment) [Candidatus Sulfopaludibacter sp. SbA3]